jgi:hypothetical protein
MNAEDKIKHRLNEMTKTIKNAYVYKFDPTPPSRNAMEIRRLIEYSKITELKK